MLEKREDHIQKQIDEETRKAKANATSNQRRKSLFWRARESCDHECKMSSGADV